MYYKLRSILNNEILRQHSTINLIASENYTSKSVREAVGSVFMHKYSEGNIGSRYYQGNVYIDELESLAIELVKKVFKLPEYWSANVQALAGSNANLIVYNSILNPGDKILSMFLPDGGHLSHGWSLPDNQITNLDLSRKEDFMVHRGGSKKVSIVSKFYEVIQYKTDPETELLDYDFIYRLAEKEKPKLIITGGTAYPRNINYTKMAEIAKSVGSYYLADIAHEAGLVAAGVLDSPVGIADFVTMTTHKTLRGPKGAIILANNELIKKVNKSVIPGIQGGPHNGTIAGIVQTLFEASTEEFKNYAQKILENAKYFETALKDLGFRLVSGGTDKHLLVIDLRNYSINGKLLSEALEHINIITNMNTIPYDPSPPISPSGIRIGTPAITTRKMWKDEVIKISNLIYKIVELLKDSRIEFQNLGNYLMSNDSVKKMKSEVLEICDKFPIDL